MNFGIFSLRDPSQDKSAYETATITNRPLREAPVDPAYAVKPFNFGIFNLRDPIRQRSAMLSTNDQK